MPRAVEENLAGMLNFEMDRHTPFRAEDVFFTQRVISRDRASEKIAVELVVVPKRSAAQFADRLANVRITASSMVVGLQDGALAVGEFEASANLLTREGKTPNRSAIRQSRRWLETLPCQSVLDQRLIRLYLKILDYKPSLVRKYRHL